MPAYPRLLIAGLVGLGLANPTLAESVLDRLKETGEIRLGVRADAAPLSWLQGGKPAGYSVLVCGGVGVRDGTTTEASLQATLEATGIEAEVVTFDSHQAALTALEDGEIAAYFGDQSILFGLFFASDMADTLVVSDNMLTVEKHGLAMPRGDDDFRLAVDTAISTLFRTGRMEAFFEESFPGATPGLALRALFLLGPDMP